MMAVGSVLSDTACDWDAQRDKKVFDGCNQTASSGSRLLVCLALGNGHDDTSRRDDLSKEPFSRCYSWRHGGVWSLGQGSETRVGASGDVCGNADSGRENDHPARGRVMSRCVREQPGDVGFLYVQVSQAASGTESGLGQLDESEKGD